MARFFEALVVAGAGLSLSGYACGGKTSLEPGDDSSGGAGSAGSAGNAGGAGLGVAGYGGSVSDGGGVSTGGVAGSYVAGSAGAAGAGATGTVPPPEVAAQWNCYAPDLGACDTYSPNYLFKEYSLDAPCQIDPMRPRRASDCGGEAFLCTAASYQGAEIFVNCGCAPVDPTCTCINGNGTYGGSSCDGLSQRCFCAYAGILK